MESVKFYLNLVVTTCRSMKSFGSSPVQVPTNVKGIQLLDWAVIKAGSHFSWTTVFPRFSASGRLLIFEVFGGALTRAGTLNKTYQN